MDSRASTVSVSVLCHYHLWPESRTRSCSDRYCVLTTTQSHRQTDGRTDGRRRTLSANHIHTHTRTVSMSSSQNRMLWPTNPIATLALIYMWLLSAGAAGCFASSTVFLFLSSIRSFFVSQKRDPRIFVYTYTYGSSVRPFVRACTHVFFVRHGWADPHPHPLLIAFYIMVVSYVYIVASCWPVRVTPD